MKPRLVYLLRFAALLALPALMGCEEIIDYDLQESQKILVIDGLITDQPTAQYVKLSLTAPYLQNQPTPRVSGALVVVRDDMNHTDTLQEQLPGEYMLDTNIVKGQVGHAYTLYVNYGGKEYHARNRILPITGIDSLTYLFHKEDPNYPDDGYYVTMYAQEPAGKGNNYRFKFIVNDYFAPRADRFIVANDEFVDGQYVTFTTPFPVQYNDTVVLEAQSLTKAAYDYYAALTVQMSPNGFFDTPPANLPTNITGGALGFFNTVSVKRKGIRIR